MLLPGSKDESSPTTPLGLDGVQLPTVGDQVPKSPNKGPEFVITPAEAATLCETLGPAQLLRDLNRLTKMTHLMTDKRVDFLITLCISNGYDFGVAYGRLRQIWTSKDVSRAWDDVMADKKASAERKEKAFQTDAISGTRTLVSPYIIPARRMWDLYSHRVVPLHFVRNRDALWAISHSWRSKLVPVSTPVNEGEWPVPMPPGVTLEMVRDEMLGFGAEHCWLDVVCNRQRNGRDDSLMVPEFAVDLPTMGNIYMSPVQIVRYYNGLGCPFQPSGFDDTHHWLNRAWTLQEINEHTIIGGMPVPMPDEMPFAPVTGWEYDGRTDPFPELSRRLRPLADIAFGDGTVAKVVKQMRTRESGRPLDQIYGMGYLIRCPTLPVYNKNLTMEAAWWLLIQCMTDIMRGELLLLYPEPGTGARKWFPTWEQLLSRDMLHTATLAEVVKLLPDGTVSYNACLLQNCQIVGTKITVMDGPRKDCIIDFFVHNEACPPPGQYTLVGDSQADYFIVCKFRPDLTALLEKVSVVRLNSDASVTVAAWRLSRSVCVFG